MTWIWISTVVVLLGAELNAEMERQTLVDTTVGAERPLGAAPRRCRRHISREGRSDAKSSKAPAAVAIAPRPCPAGSCSAPLFATATPRFSMRRGSVCAILASILVTGALRLPYGMWSSITVLVVIGGLQHQGNIRSKAFERGSARLIGAASVCDHRAARILAARPPRPTC